MSSDVNITNEMKVAAAFNRQSSAFDDIYASNTIVQYKRKRVRAHVEQFISPRSKILELNAGTGDDAIYFAQHGHFVHATDISEGMQAKLAQKIKGRHLEKRITHEVCSFTNVQNLNQRGPYDVIFSNFAGLNCTNELEKVLRSFSSLLKENGTVTLVMLPNFCLWETLLMFRGKFRTALRRFFAGNGRKAHIEGEHFLCWYYNPSFIRKTLQDEFDVLSVEGLCALVPPSYIENFAEDHPRLFKQLHNLEAKWKNKWPWRLIGDYYIISLRKKPNLPGIESTDR